ncbi:MAG: hypothetical protein ACI9MC_001221 [Kiritimatiellia bacterium]|jgi:hypothetical protein
MNKTTHRLQLAALACVVGSIAQPLAGCGDEATPLDPAADSVVEVQPDSTETVSVDAADSAADTAVPTDTAPPEVEVAPLHVLFVGNSYTEYNGLPSVVAALIERTQQGSEVQTSSVLVGGAGLFDHWEKTGAQQLVEAGDYDVVVIQGQSIEPFQNGFGFSFYADKFQALAAAAGKRVIWYGTWARREGNEYYSWTGAPKPPAEMARRLDGLYNLPGGVTARVGAAFQIALTEIPEIELYASDDSHPSPAGSLLASCVIAHAITGEPIVLPEPVPLGIDRDIAESLCALAPRVRCYFERTLCDGECVFTANNPDYCGGCGQPCAPGVPCGSVAPGECGCREGLIACGDYCTYTELDAAHCGGCGNACDLGEACVESTCACRSVEAFLTRMRELTAANPACNSDGMPSLAACDEALHTVCAGIACFGTSIGMLWIPPATNPYAQFDNTCLAAETQVTDYDALTAIEPGCNGGDPSPDNACDVAIQRLCTTTGATSGFGPVVQAGDQLTVSCVADATSVMVPWTNLLADGCEKDKRASPSCRSVVIRECRGRAFATGFGPIHYAVADDAVIVCVP